MADRLKGWKLDAQRTWAKRTGPRVKPAKDANRPGPSWWCAVDRPTFTRLVAQKDQQRHQERIFVCDDRVPE